MLNHPDENTTFSFEAEPEGSSDCLIAIVLNTIVEQQFKCYII